MSPLLYAICAEVLLEKIRKECPKAVVRAYADDTAATTPDIEHDGPILERIFKEFADFSGLNLNMKKTSLIPLRKLDARTLKSG